MVLGVNLNYIDLLLDSGICVQAVDVEKDVFIRR